MMIEAPAIERDMIKEASAAVYKRWSRYVSHAEALAEAENFAKRARAIAGEAHLTSDELDAVLDRVSEVMGAPA